jgi:hypothetical protein
MSEVQRITGVFFEPSKAFADLGRKQSWWVPWLLVSLISLAFVYSVQQKVGWDQVIETQINKSPKAVAAFEKMQPDQRQKQMAMQVTIGKAFAWGNPILALIAGVIVAAVLMGIYNFGLGSKVGFGRSVAIFFYSSLVSIISAALMIVTVFLVEPDTYDISKPLASNVGVWVDTVVNGFSANHRFLFGVLTVFDVFTLWSIFLIAIGFEQCTKVKRGKGFVTILLVYLAFKVITSGLGAITAG